MISIKLEKILHRKAYRIRLITRYSEPMNLFLKALATSRYSATLKNWYIDYSPEALSDLQKKSAGKYQLDSNGIILHYASLSYLGERSRYQLKFSEHCFQHWVVFIEENFYAKKMVKDSCWILKIDPHKQVVFKDYFREQFVLFKKQNFEEGEIFSSEIKPLEKFTDQKVNKSAIMTTDEVGLFFKKINDERMHLIFTLIYACGLRRSEVVLIKREHIDLENQSLLVLNTKGKTDRNLNINKQVLNSILEYLEKSSPIIYLFESQAGSPIDVKSISRYFKSMLKTVGLTIKYSVHSLRQSYAIHLLNEGYSIQAIQNFLGHKSLKTTRAFTRMQRVKTVEGILSIENIPL